MPKEQEKPAEKSPGSYSPAYTSFKTFKSFIKGINPSAIPRQLDKSMMRNISGGAQRKLWSGLIFLRLITPEGIVTDNLRNLVIKKDQPEWKMLLGQLINGAYAPILKDLDVTTATVKQLEDTFRAAKVEGATLIDAIRFYVHARNEAGAPVSPYITARQPRSSSNGTGSKNNGAAPRATKPAIQKNDGEVPQKKKPGMIEIPIFAPGKPQGTVTIHEDLNDDDVEMISAILRAYAKRRSSEDPTG